MKTVSTLSADPHRVLTISLPDSLLKALEVKQRSIENEIGVTVPMSRLVANCVRKQLDTGK